MSELTNIDREVLQLITRFEGATDPMQDAMSQASARQLLSEIVEYDLPGVQLSEDTVSFIAQLQRALSPVPYEGWRSDVAGIAWCASHLLVVAGTRA